MRVEVFPRVEPDLDAITRYIAQHNPARAISFVAELRGQFRIIGQNPQIYRLRPEVAPEMRIAPYGNYLILFRIAKDTVEIRRVVHGARSMKMLSL